MVVRTRSPEETEAIGHKFALGLSDDCVVGLYGDLGAGKTCFVRGAARAFHVSDIVSSPTFSLVNVYRGDRKIVHMDAYRLKSPDEMMRIGFEDYLAEGGICFIEWAERIKGIMPVNSREVRFIIVKDTERDIEIIEEL